jgi:DNA-binding NarL/FixJ family response regulator
MVSRAKKLFSYIKKQLENVGFPNVVVTGEEKDSLNMLINDMKPCFVIVESWFYHAATPYMMGRLLKLYPKLNITAITICEFPDDLAAWFIWHGVKSYVNMQEGIEEFYQGLEEVRKGKEYITPQVQYFIDQAAEWPEATLDVKKRQMEVLILLCKGFTPEHIGQELQISKRTVDWHLGELYRMFHVKNREEMVALAWELDLVTKNDMWFYGRTRTIDPLPVWAAAKQKTGRELLHYDHQDKRRGIQGGK